MRVITYPHLALLAASVLLGDALASRHGARLRHRHRRQNNDKATAWVVEQVSVTVYTDGRPPSTGAPTFLSTSIENPGAPETETLHATITVPPPAENSPASPAAALPQGENNDVGSTAHVEEAHPPDPAVAATPAAPSPQDVAPVGRGPAPAPETVPPVEDRDSTSSVSPPGVVSGGVTPTTGGDKRGIGFNWGSMNDLGGLKNTDVTWAQNWDAYSVEKLKPFFDTLPNCQYSPNLWGGPNGDDVAHQYTQFESMVKEYAASEHAPKGKDLVILTFNEPDQCGGGGGCMMNSTDQPDFPGAASVYQTKLAEFQGVYSIVSPGITSDQTAVGKGLSWFDGWQEACDGNCPFDYMGAHYYIQNCEDGKGAEYADNMMKYLETVYSKGGNKQIVLSELGCMGGSDDAQVNFIRAAVPLLNQSPMIFRYAYHYAAIDFLLKDPQSLSTIGEAYFAA